MRNSLLLLISLLVFSCTGKNDIPDGVLKPDKMQEVFWDYLLSDIYITEYMKRDTGKNIAIENLKLQEKIFKSHQTSREEFYKSYAWYSNHKELMKTMLDSMITKNKRQKTRVNLNTGLKSL